MSRRAAIGGRGGSERVEQINAELFVLTYGALVAQLVRDLEDVDAVNKRLEEMGHSIGLRLVDEFLAKSHVTGCGSFKETAEMVVRGFKMFLNVTPAVQNWNEQGTECVFVLDDNPLEDFVQLPEELKGLSYSGSLCGVLRGALESVHLAVDCSIVADKLRGDPKTQIKMTLLHVIKDQAGEDYRED